MGSTFWFVTSCIIAVMDAVIGYRQRDVVSIAFSLIWAFMAGLHFAQVGTFDISMLMATMNFALAVE